MIVRYSDGSFVEGVIKKLEGASLCVEVAGLDKQVCFLLVDGIWRSECGSAVTLEFPSRVSMQFFHSVDEPGKCAAGGDCVLKRMWHDDTPTN